MPLPVIPTTAIKSGVAPVINGSAEPHTCEGTEYVPAVYFIP